MKYEPVFKLPYSNVFLSDLIFQSGYKDIDPIMILKNGGWELFLSEETLKILSENRFNEVLNNNNFEDFKNRSSQAAEEVLKLSKEDISKLDREEFISFLDKFFEIGCRFFGLYSQTEFFYFTKIEQEINAYINGKLSFQEVLSGDADLTSWPEDKRKLADYIINMQHFKLELRKIMNEAWMGPNAAVSRLLEQLVIRTNREDAPSMTFNEIKDCLIGKEIKDISERHVYSYMNWNKENREINIFSGGEGYRKIRELDKQIPKNEVIGVPACKGIAKGRAKIIPLSMNPEQYLSKMEKGDILVSDTTGPEMVVAIEKASAIVTDEGGQMSHAAIVSREFNIPCVVGTRYATEVFKDGDLIEVNAFNGIVRKI